MAIGNIGLTAALSQMAQEQMKQKLQDQQATQEANKLAQALQLHREQMAMQEQQKGLDWIQEQARLQNAKDIAYINAQSRENIQGMKGDTAKDIAAQKAANKKAGLDPQFNNLVKFQNIWKEKGVENLKSPQAQEELLAGIESGTYDPTDAQALISNPYWGIDKTRHDAFEAKKNKVLGLSTAPTTQAGGGIVTTPVSQPTGKPLTNEATTWYRNQLAAGQPSEALKKHLLAKGYDVSGL